MEKQWRTGHLGNRANARGPSSLIAGVLGRCTHEHSIVDLSTGDGRYQMHNAFTISDYYSSRATSILDLVTTEVRHDRPSLQMGLCWTWHTL